MERDGEMEGKLPPRPTLGADRGVGDEEGRALQAPLVLVEAWDGQVVRVRSPTKSIVRSPGKGSSTALSLPFK